MRQGVSPMGAYVPVPIHPPQRIFCDFSLHFKNPKIFPALELNDAIKHKLLLQRQRSISSINVTVSENALNITELCRVTVTEAAGHFRNSRAN